jgi:transcriptional regulator with XRE-family HTH domain
MIKNERQFKVTRAQLHRFEAALEDLEAKPETDPIQRQLELDTARSQVTELQHQLDEYTGLRDGTVAVGTPADLSELPRYLIRQRIAAGLTQRELGERLGMKEQQIQRYEADDWGTASLRRLIEVADAVGLRLNGHHPVLADAIEERQMYRGLAAQGLDRDFIGRRLRPKTDDAVSDVIDLTARLNRIYHWPPSAVARGEVDEPQPTFALASSFKMPKRHDIAKTRAYTVYSQYLALLTLDATPHLQPSRLPTNAGQFRALVLERFDTVNYDSILETAWNNGVVVLPLADPGSFHAVLWRAHGRNVIILKQQNRSRSRWAFDLLHELRHGEEEPEQETYAVLDDDVPTDARSELVANRFAGNVLLDGRAEELAEIAVEAADNSVERLKAVVPRVAADHDVATADLANYLAYRLSLQGLNWWGTAQNLQGRGADPWQITRRRFLAECDLTRLPPLDRDLLLQALEDIA